MLSQHFSRTTYSALFNFLKKFKFYIFGTILLVLVLFLFSHNILNIEAATFDWIQTTWSGGPSSAVANHNENQSGWTFFSSKSSNLSTSNNQLKISMITGATKTDDTDADFETGTFSNAYVASNSVIMKKPINATCSTNEECASDYCTGSPATCQIPPVACDGSTGTLHCGNLCTYQGQVYGTVQIGTQCWLADNLRTTTYPDGSPITKGPAGYGAAFGDNTTAYYSCPSNLTSSGNTDGEDCTAAGGSLKLGMYYQWKAAMNGAAAVASGQGPQGICPNGWHIPTDDGTTNSDIGLLLSAVDNISGCSGNEATCLRSGGASGFNFPWSGYRTDDGYYWKRAGNAIFWTASSGSSAGYVRVENLDSNTVTHQDSQPEAMPVRCVRNY